MTPSNRPQHQDVRHFRNSLAAIDNSSNNSININNISTSNHSSEQTPSRPRNGGDHDLVGQRDPRELGPSSSRRTDDHLYRASPHQPDLHSSRDYLLSSHPAATGALQTFATAGHEASYLRPSSSSRFLRESPSSKSRPSSGIYSIDFAFGSPAKSDARPFTHPRSSPAATQGYSSTTALPPSTSTLTLGTAGYSSQLARSSRPLASTFQEPHSTTHIHTDSTSRPSSSSGLAHLLIDETSLSSPETSVRHHQHHRSLLEAGQYSPTSPSGRHRRQLLGGDTRSISRADQLVSEGPLSRLRPRPRIGGSANSSSFSATRFDAAAGKLQLDRDPHTNSRPSTSILVSAEDDYPSPRYRLLDRLASEHGSNRSKSPLHLISEPPTAVAGTLETSRRRACGLPPLHVPTKSSPTRPATSHSVHSATDLVPLSHHSQINSDAPRSAAPPPSTALLSQPFYPSHSHPALQDSSHSVARTLPEVRHSLDGSFARDVLLDPASSRPTSSSSSSGTGNKANIANLLNGESRPSLHNNPTRPRVYHYSSLSYDLDGLLGAGSAGSSGSGSDSFSRPSSSYVDNLFTSRKSTQYLSQPSSQTQPPSPAPLLTGLYNPYPPPIMPPRRPSQSSTMSGSTATTVMTSTLPPPARLTRAQAAAAAAAASSSTYPHHQTYNHSNLDLRNYPPPPGSSMAPSTYRDFSGAPRSSVASSSGYPPPSGSIGSRRGKVYRKDVFLNNGKEQSVTIVEDEEDGGSSLHPTPNSKRKVGDAGKAAQSSLTTSNGKRRRVDDDPPSSENKRRPNGKAGTTSSSSWTQSTVNTAYGVQATEQAMHRYNPPTHAQGLVSNNLLNGQTSQQPPQQYYAQPAARPQVAVASNQTYSNAAASGSGRQAYAQAVAPATNEPPPWDDKDGHYVVQAGTFVGAKDKYRIIRLLGQGTFGKVVEAKEGYSSRKVAIKIIRAVQKYRDAAAIEIRVLRTLKEHDNNNFYKCIHLIETFDFRNHICLVSELLGMSVFDFLKQNHYQPFPEAHIQSFARSLLHSLSYVHSLRLIHTDLKPENILLVSNGSYTIGERRAGAKQKSILRNTDIRLIDFGSATFENEFHSTVVSTRHYRAPEIILGLGWSYPCDMYSIGCILVEFFTGEALYQTHDNLEHLAMMEAVMGKMPSDISRRASRTKSEFFRGTRLDYPNAHTTKNSKKYVKAMKRLDQIIPPTTPLRRQFLDLISKMLDFDPDKRIDVHKAVNHPYFSIAPPPVPAPPATDRAS